MLSFRFLQGYVLEFYFKPNEYFEETLLTKTYHLKIAIDEKDPMSFDGPEITKCTGLVAYRSLTTALELYIIILC